MMHQLRQKALELGAYRAEIVDVCAISTDASFRKLCEQNTCGNYGKNYQCPPDAGEIDVLIREIKTYDKAMVYQTVSKLEDSYDFEGMMAAAKKHNQLAQKLWDYLDLLAEKPENQEKHFLHLGAGGCRLCDVCGKKTGEPCRHPNRAMRSLETYGINVSALAKQAGMHYINGQNTVTYFGAIFFQR